MTKKQVYITEEHSGLNACCNLLLETAPACSQFLWDFALEKPTFGGIHAMWTGPEISCPIIGQDIPQPYRQGGMPKENATSYPEAGDIALAFVHPNEWSGLPPNQALLDIGLFYGKGARTLMPFGWIAVSVAAQVIAEDLAGFVKACGEIRQRGACKISLHT